MIQWMAFLTLAAAPAWGEGECVVTIQAFLYPEKMWARHSDHLWKTVAERKLRVERLENCREAAEEIVEQPVLVRGRRMVVSPKRAKYSFIPGGVVYHGVEMLGGDNDQRPRVRRPPVRPRQRPTPPKRPIESGR